MRTTRILLGRRLVTVGPIQITLTGSNKAMKASKPKLMG